MNVAVAKPFQFREHLRNSGEGPIEELNDYLAALGFWHSRCYAFDLRWKRMIHV
jgi:hypothetical protein